MPSIEVRNISKRFEDSIAIEDISFKLKDGDLLTLLGPSGSGKTTVLRLIAGLIKPDSGQIFYDDVDISEVPTEERNIGFVFQSYALFPHLTVVENIAFGLYARKWPKSEIIARVKEMLKLVELEGKGNRYPRELSGGEKSRVALARALTPNPSLLLLDEPLSALDMSLKESLSKAIRDIQQKVGVSTIYVTHDQRESMSISDEIIILNHGRIVEFGTPEKLYLTPKKKFTAEFLGIANILEGTIISKKDGDYLETPFGQIKLPPDPIPRDHESLSIAIFPEHLSLARSPVGQENEFQGKISRVSFEGALIDFTVQLRDVDFTVQITSSRIKKQFQQGEEVFITIPPSSILILED